MKNLLATIGCFLLFVSSNTPQEPRKDTDTSVITEIVAPVTTADTSRYSEPIKVNLKEQVKKADNIVSKSKEVYNTSLQALEAVQEKKKEVEVQKVEEFIDNKIINKGQ